jgi:hypothetical protein
MVVFSVRIDFYRDLEGPKDYVGSALRDGLSAVVLPRVGEHVLGLGPDAWRKGPYGEPYSVVQAVEHRATPAWKLDPTTPERRRTRPSCSCFRRCGRVMAPWPARACCGSTTLRAAGSSTSSATTPRSSHSRATRSWAGSTSKAGDAHEQPASDRDPGGRHVPRRVAGSPHPHQPGSARASGRTWRCSTPSPRATRAEPPAGRLAAGRLARRDCRHNRCHGASGPPTRRDLLVPTDRIWEQ